MEQRYRYPRCIRDVNDTIPSFSPVHVIHNDALYRKKNVEKKNNRRKEKRTSTDEIKVKGEKNHIP